jgi:hypothetical protein
VDGWISDGGRKWEREENGKEGTYWAAEKMVSAWWGG